MTFGFFWLGAVRLVTELSPASLPATGQGLLSAAVGGVGAAGGVFIGQQLVAHYDTVMLYQVAAFVALITAVLSLRLRHEI